MGAHQTPLNSWGVWSGNPKKKKRKERKSRAQLCLWAELPLLKSLVQRQNAFDTIPWRAGTNLLITETKNVNPQNKKRRRKHKSCELLERFNFISKHLQLKYTRQP